VRRTIWLVVALGSAGAVASAQPTPTPTRPSASSPSSSGPCSAILTSQTCAAGTQLLTGTVWDYSPGRNITIKVDDGRQVEMPLEPGVRVDGSVAVGHLASLMWASDSAGKTKVMSITAAPGSADDIEHSAPSVPSRPTAVSSSAPASGGATPTKGPARPTPTPRSR